MIVTVFDVVHMLSERGIPAVSMIDDDQRHRQLVRNRRRHREYSSTWCYIININSESIACTDF